MLTNSKNFLTDLRSRANSGVQVNLSSKEIKNSEAVLPPENINSYFSELTLPIFDTIINNQIENHYLLQLKKNLLPKFMSGEIDVSSISLQKMEVNK